MTALHPKALAPALSGIALGAAALALLGVSPALAQQTLKVQTSQSAGDFTFIYMTEKWAPKVEAMSGGQLKLELLPAGSVVPYRETMDAVATASWTAISPRSPTSRAATRRLRSSAI